MKASTIFSILIATTVTAQQGAWQQCGGIGWSGGTSCISGWVCKYSNPWYSQCLQGSSSPPAPTSSASGGSGGSGNNGGSSGGIKATFTEYGSGDINGSPNCATAENACGYPQPGYTAALSQAQFGAGPGQGAGPACGRCYKITIDTDLSGNSVPSRTITVKINNLCPINGNPICNTPNQYGGQIHFDLCKDSGAAGAFFTNSEAGIGTAVEVGC